MRIARALAAIGIILSTLALLCFAANVALTLRTMSQGLNETNARLAQTNRLLWGTNARLDSTQAQILVSNRQLSHIASDVHATVAGLAQTNGNLDETNRTLWSMAGQIRLISSQHR